MRPSRLKAAVAASITLLLPSAQAATAVPNTNLDFSNLGQVALAGDFDSISVYEYEGQKEGFSNNGSTSILSSLPNGAYRALASTDASINAMVNFVLSDGTLAGVIVGGNFTSIGGVDAASVALFNPKTNEITPLPGIHGAVTSLYNVPETDTIYVGGSFEAANSTNAIAWIGTTGWANLPFAGFNAPVTSITRAVNGNIVFGGSFSGLGNMTTPTGSKANAQVINLSSANITTLESTGAAGFRNPKNIVCPSNGTDGTSSTWLLADQVAGWWRADMGFGYEPTKLRLWNTNQDGRGTKTFRFVAHPINGIMNFTYTDPATGKRESCDAECTLSHNASNPYQDFTFVNVIGMNSFTIEILDWYGAGAGLDGVELFQDAIFVYADNDFNEPSCSGAEFPSTATKTGPWSTIPSGNSTNQYLGATVQGSTLDQTAVVFQPDMKTKGNYSVIIYTPGCLQDSTCATRGVVNVSGTLTSDGGTAFSTQIFQTNQYEKYDQIYLGEVDAASSGFRPSVTLTPAASQGNIHVVASRVKFGQLSLTGGLNGLFEYNPNLATVNTDFSQSAINNAGTSLKPSAQITALITKDQTIYAAGSFSDDTFDNIMAFKNNKATSLPGGGLDDAVSTMYTLDDYMYVGGNFSKTQTGSVQGLNNIGAFSFSKNSWTALGAGLDGPVYSVVPLQLNITADTPETTIAISGDFNNIKASGSSSSKPANGLAVWVPSHNDWLQNLNVTQLALAGKLCSYVDIPKGPYLVAGDLASAGWGISGAAGLSKSGDSVLLEQLPIKIASSNTQSSLTKRELIGSENVTGVVVGTYYENSGRNVTVFGGHFTGTATNGSSIQNLLFLNGSDNNQVTGMKPGIESNSTFLALATQSDLLFAGGAVTGQVGDVSVNGLVVYDMLAATYRTPQPAALVGPNVVVNSIQLLPGTTQLYVGGSFQETAQQLACASVCMYDTSTNQWNSVGSNLDGTVTALSWSTSKVLMAAGNLTLNANGSSAGSPTYVATYNTKQQTWTAIKNNAIPGTVTAFAPAMQDGSNYWVAGTAKNGSTFLINMDNDNDKPVWHAFNAGTNIRGIAVHQLTSSHGSSQYLDKDQSLLLTGMINLPNFGNVSAALFNGTAFEPFILSSTNSGGPGSISQVFTSKTNLPSGNSKSSCTPFPDQANFLRRCPSLTRYHCPGRPLRGPRNHLPHHHLWPHPHSHTASSCGIQPHPSGPISRQALEHQPRAS
jgi:hypothetical protein